MDDSGDQLAHKMEARTHIFIVLPVRDDDLDWGHIVGSMGLDGGAHAVLEQLQQHIGQMARHIREVQVGATVDRHLGGVSVGALTHICCAFNRL